MDTSTVPAWMFWDHGSRVSGRYRGSGMEVQHDESGMDALGSRMSFSGRLSGLEHDALGSRMRSGQTRCFDLRTLKSAQIPMSRQSVVQAARKMLSPCEPFQAPGVSTSGATCKPMLGAHLTCCKKKLFGAHWSQAEKQQPAEPIPNARLTLLQKAK